MLQFFTKTHPKKTLAGIAVLLLWYWFCLPRPLFKDPTSMVLEDRAGNLLGARIAADGQWRFPEGDSLPEKFTQALIEFEDRRFFRHPGVDPRGLARAFNQNIRSGRIVSGGSTLTMQVIRMARKKKKRTVWQKVVEIIQATRLELKYSKKKILALHASNAPFGGNVVGLEAASWRYFGKSPHLLSWAESAMLAVLPNSPGLIHPGRNRQALFDKRNRLLDRLLEKGKLDSLTCRLAKEEPLPEKPLPLPRLAPHLLDRAYLDYVRPGKTDRSRIRTTIMLPIQRQANHILKHHQQILQHNEVHNLAAVVIEVKTGDIVAYVGNVIGAGEDHGEQVDVIKAPRSTGSILKPLLYSLMLQEGQILPESLIPDVPTQLGGYRPENFHEQYDGVVTARRALIRSLNVPMVYMLQRYCLEKFHFELQALGFHHVNQPASHYGLPLILGGAEASLWEITNTYASMSRTLRNFYKEDGLYDPKDFRDAQYLLAKPIEPSPRKKQWQEAPRMSAAGIWFTFNAMQEVERPNSVGNWKAFRSSRRIAWKTGTSFGFRDAWAVGVTPEYAVGVWAGNADGEGRPGLVGVQAAAPVLFDIFNALPAASESGLNWFDPPYDEMTQIPICKESGYRALPICPTDSTWIPLSGLHAPACPYHQTIHLDQSESWQVGASCESPDQIVHQPWFVLPPLEAHFYRSKNPNYRSLPPIRSDCQQALVEGDSPMQLIYPKQPTQIYVPIDLDGEPSRTVFSVAHNDADATIHWHIDAEYIGSTSQFHQMEFKPSVGQHMLTLVDEVGNRLALAFEVIGKETSR